MGGDPSVPLDVPVLAVHDAIWTWGDVVATASAWGEWQAVEDLAARGVACEQRARAEGDPLPRDEVRRRGDAWRRAQLLLAAEDATAWLAAHGVTVRGWLAHLHRAALREHWPEQRAACPASFAATWVEALCSGELHRLADLLGRRAALAVGAGAPRPGPAELLAAERALLDGDLPPRLIRSIVARHALEWTRVDLRLVRTRQEHVARELACCVRYDGDRLEDVARAAGLPVEHTACTLEQVPPARAAHVTTAAAGDVLGPISFGDQHEVLVLDARIPPRPEDPAVRELARRWSAESAVRAAAREHVRWLGPRR